MAAKVLFGGVAAAVAKEARHRTDRAEFEPITEHVARCVAAAPAAIAAVVSQHCGLPRLFIVARTSEAMSGFCASNRDTLRSSLRSSGLLVLRACMVPGSVHHLLIRIVLTAEARTR